MRLAGAGFLAFLILLQWSLGFLSCISYSQEIEVLYKMDAQEAAISQRLLEEFDLQHQVRISREDPSSRRGAFYDAPFFTEIEGSDTIQFQLVHEVFNTESHPQPIFKYPLPHGQDPLEVSLHSFFTKYFSQGHNGPAPFDLALIQQGTLVPLPLVSVSVDVPTPPPKSLFG